MELEDYEEEIEESIDYKFEKYSEKILIWLNIIFN